MTGPCLAGGGDEVVVSLSLSLSCSPCVGEEGSQEMCRLLCLRDGVDLDGKTMLGVDVNFEHDSKHRASVG